MHDGLLFRHTRIARPEGRERQTGIPAFRRLCFEIADRLEMLAEPMSDKLMFRVYDYTGATDLFGRKFLSPPPPEGPKPPPPRPPPPPPESRILVQGFDVFVNPVGHSIPVEVNGVMTKMSVEEYKQRLARRLIEEATYVSDFRDLWIVRNKRLELFGRLPDAGRSPLLVRALEKMDD